MRLLLNSILLFILLGGCIDVKKEEQIKVGLNYEHAYRTRLVSDPVPVRHHIDVLTGNIIHASADLDTNLSARVEIPVDISLTVDYKNYTSQYPDIHYEYGTSDPFYVTHHSPDSLTINISVAVNSNYPVEETETIDNTTIDNETVVITDNLTWSDNFTYNVAPTQEQKIRWIEFIDNMTNDNWTSISIGNPDNMTTCDNATLLSNVIAETKENATYELLKQSCNGMYWNWGICYNGREIGAYSTPQNDCRCAISGYTLRPSFFNKNWGGVGKACNSDNQTLQVILSK